VTEKARALKIDGVRYRWRVTHRHLPESTLTNQRLCVDHFLAFHEGTAGATLRIHFPQGSPGDPGFRHGLIIVRALNLSINLHRPRSAAALVRGALEQGWSADAPMSVDDGYTFVSSLPTAVLSGIAEQQTGCRHDDAPGLLVDDHPIVRQVLRERTKSNVHAPIAAVIRAWRSGITPWPIPHPSPALASRRAGRRTGRCNRRTPCAGELS
jgi:hypothetical protein